MIDITHKLVKEIMDCLKKQCIKFTNTEKKEQLKETEFPWNPDEKIAVYFTKLHKKKERFEKIGISWDDTQKVTREVDEIYTSRQMG